MKATYQVVPIDKLRPDPKQPRRHIDEDSIKGMSVSIKSEGVINPIEVDENFIIVTGERRWRSSKLAGLKEVPIKIIPGLSAHDRFIRQVQENIHQNTMAPLDTAEALDKIRKWLPTSTVEVARDEFHKGARYQKGVTELHKLLGIPESTISESLDLLGEPEEMKKALRVPGFQMTKVKELKKAPKKYREKLRDLVSSQRSIPRDTVRHIATALNRAEKYDEKESAEQLLNENFEGLHSFEALTKINKIVKDEASRIKEPADAVRIISEKAIELMELLEEHPLESLDPVHRDLTIKDLNALGFYLGGYLQGKDMKDMRIKGPEIIG
jgi:ParB/RepB/Spo0J family partition protein